MFVGSCIPKCSAAQEVVHTTRLGVAVPTQKRAIRLASWFSATHRGNQASCKDENETQISRSEPYRFLYFIRSNSYFYVRLYCFRYLFRISNVKVENGLVIFQPFSTFNSEYLEFKIQFKPNLVANHYCPDN
jgi:hypothetical protein